MPDHSLKRQLKVLTIPVFIEMALVMLLGAVDTVMLSRYSDNSVAAVGPVSALLFFYAEQLLQLMGLRSELMGDGLVYLRLTGALSFFQALSLTFSASLRSADKVVYPMVVTGVVNVLNIFGNYALIFGHWGCPQLGVEGAAIATAASRAVAMVLLAVIHFKVHIPRFPLHYFRPIPWQELRNLLYIGIPAMSENISYCLSQVVITYFINQISNEALATRTYCHNMIMFVYLFCLSITQGGDILVGHLVGQRRHQAAYVLGNYFSMGVWVLVIDWFLEIGRTSNIFAGSTLRATGDTIYPFVVGIIFQWSIAVGLSYVIGIPLGYGLVGMWVGFALDENVRGVILMRRWRSGKWKSKGFVNDSVFD